MSDASEQLQNSISEALSQENAIQIKGSGSKDFYGGDITGTILSTHEHSGVINYEPKELVITARSGTALLEISREFKQKALLVIVDQAKFRAVVRPGSQLFISISVLSLTDSAAQLDGTISRDEKVIMNGRLTFALEPVEKFYPQKTR